MRTTIGPLSQNLTYQKLPGFHLNLYDNGVLVGVRTITYRRSIVDGKLRTVGLIKHKKVVYQMKQGGLVPLSGVSC